MKRLLIVLVLCLVTALANSASASIVPPTLDEVVNGSMLVTDMSLLTGIAHSGQSYVSLTDLTKPATAVATILLESAAYAGKNQLGIYNYNGLGVAPSASQMLVLFKGSAAAPSSATVEFDLAGGLAWYDRNSNSVRDAGETASIGTTFGFFLISPDNYKGICNPTFFTDEKLNPDTKKTEHGLIYDTRHITGAISGDPDVVVAFEDLLAGHADWDYDDMVVGVSDVAPVPEPMTIALLGLGSLVFIRKRRA
jgi:hypothetical protein